MKRYIALSSTFNEKGNLKLKGNELAVLMAIKKFYPKSFPSIQRICKITDLCKKTVLKYLRELELKKIIMVINRKGTSNLYRIADAFLSAKEIEAFKKVYAFLSEKIQTRVRKPEFLGKIRKHWEKCPFFKSTRDKKYPNPPGAFCIPQSTRKNTYVSTKLQNTFFNFSGNRGMESLGAAFRI